MHLSVIFFFTDFFNDYVVVGLHEENESILKMHPIITYQVWYIFSIGTRVAYTDAIFV